jgi:hypothetical protein
MALESTFVSQADDRVIYRPGHYGRKGWVLANSVAVRLRDVLAAQRYDVVFVYREAIALNTSIIERLFARSSRRVAMGANARAVVTAGYSVEAYSSHFLSALVR